MKALALALGVLLAAPTLQAQPAYFATDRLDDLFGEPAVIEVNLRGSLLRLAAAATREDEPETAAMIDALEAVTVRVYDLDTARRSLLPQLDGLADSFESDGWDPFVRMRDDSTQAWIFVLSQGDAFGGMALMALDESDRKAAFVMIDGFIEPDMIARLTRRFSDIEIEEGDDE